jgi:hypothetical protein
MKAATGPIRAALRRNGRKLAEISCPGLIRMVYFSAKIPTTTRMMRPGHEKGQGVASRGI